MVDVRAWNLFGALTMAATGCMTEDAFASEENDESSFSDPAPCGRWPNGAPRPCDDPPGDDDGGNYGGCEGENDGYDDDDGWYDDDDGYGYQCYDAGDCGLGEKCVAGFCETDDAPTIPQCNDPLLVSPPIPVPEGAGDVVALAAADVDDDGRDELVVERVDGVSLVQDVGETVVPVGLPNGPEGFSVVVGRYDDSTAADLVAIDRADGTVYVLRNDGNGGLGSPNAVGVSEVTGPATPGDFNGDGNLDLLLGNRRWAGTGGGTLLAGAAVDHLAVDASRSGYQADDDPPLEIVGIHDYTDATVRWDSNGGTVENGELTPDASALFVTGDYDEDGYDDVVRLAGFGNTATFTRLLSGGGSAEHRTGAAGGAMLSADLDADGVPDVILFGGNVEAPVYVFRNVGGGVPCQLSLPMQARAVAVGDFSGDGRQDLALSSGASVSIYTVE